MADTPSRTAQELAKAALELANGARNSVEVGKALTMAVVALAGEVHALNESGKEPRTINLEIGAP